MLLKIQNRKKENPTNHPPTSSLSPGGKHQQIQRFQTDILFKVIGSPCTSLKADHRVHSESSTGFHPRKHLLGCQPLAGGTLASLWEEELLKRPGSASILSAAGHCHQPGRAEHCTHDLPSTAEPSSEFLTHPGTLQPMEEALWHMVTGWFLLSITLSSQMVKGFPSTSPKPWTMLRGSSSTQPKFN